MTSELKVDKITPASGTNTQIGEAGDTTNLSAGTVTLPTTIITGQSAKTSLADADKFLISDSAASGAFKYVESQYVGGSGGLVLVGTASQSSNTAAVQIDNCFSATYDSYLLIFDATPADNADFIMHFRSAGGSPATQTSSVYKYAFDGTNISGSSQTAYGNSQSNVQLGHSLYKNTQIDYPAISGFIYFNSPFSSTHNKMFYGNFVTWNSNGDLRAYAGGGLFASQTSLGGVRFSASSNDINNLSAKMYGLVDS